MQELFAKAEREIKKARRLAVVTHYNPDGDALGSLLAFGRWLVDRQKDFALYCASRPPAALEFLPGLAQVKAEPDEHWAKSDTVIVLDCADLGMTRLGSDEFAAKNLIVFDHHLTNGGYGQVNIVAPGAAATAEIIFQFFLSVGFAPDKETADCLLTGIYTDTDAFTNLAATAQSLRAASELVKLGADLKEIGACTVRNKSIKSLKLWGRALQRLRLDEEKEMAVTVLRKEDFAACQASEEEAEGVANLLNHLADVKIAMVLREREDGTVKGSLRTTDAGLDVSKIAKLLGGGGHAKAAGFTVPGRLAESEKGWEIV